jgi:AraC family transcriptional regulator, regulatory protein of adaptative response / methylated-DNA-[protein]-cysteine methyltransferase
MKDNIIYKEIRTPFGRMLAGASKKGICLLEFGEKPRIAETRKRVLRRYKMEMARGEHRLIDKLEDELKDYFSGKLKKFTVPLHVEGTPFQKSVWLELTKIPYGRTKSYSDIAKSVRNPKAVRAVGTANGDNCIAIVIPCHRVIAADGGIGGYGGGLSRKRFLLELESASQY